jgi:hypothetical protein
MPLVNFGPRSQVNTMAGPSCAEAREDPAGIMRECQAQADATQRPVEYCNELRAGGMSRYTFEPRVHTLETSDYYDRGQRVAP